MKRIFFLGLVLMSVLMSSEAQVPQVDKFKVSTPGIILEHKGKDNFQDDVLNTLKKKHPGVKSGQVWTVLSDRENNTTYVEPDRFSKAYATLNFREKVYVADMKNGLALVFSSGEKQTDFPQIDAPVWKGWVPVENLLLWNQCPKEKHQIYNKGVVVYTPSVDVQIKQNPNYLFAPNLNASESSVFSSDLDILYVMKTEKVDGKIYYLLSTKNILNLQGRYEEDLLGWLPQDYLEAWNYRLLLEPASSSRAVDYYKGKNIVPTIFPEDDDGLNHARDYQRTGKAEKPLWVYDKFSAQRMDNYRMRNPVLDNSAELYHVATLSTFNQMDVDIDAMNDARRRLQKYKEALNNINMIFVIDNTASMRKYYPAVAKSLEEILKKDRKSKLKVGAVLYKDYKDPKTVNYRPLTANVNEIIGFINTNKDNCGSIDPDDYEAMFEGLKTALDATKMNYNSTESNFIVLIGDAGNHRTNPTGSSWGAIVKDLARQMSENNVNFLAYQVNNTGGKADQDFGLQIGVLQKEYAKRISDKIGTKADFKLKDNRFYALERIDNNHSALPIYDTYKYLSAGQSETTVGLKGIIENNYDDFCKVVDDNIMALTGMVQSGGSGKSAGGLQESKVRDVLISMGIPEAEIVHIVKTIKQGGVVKFKGWTPLKTKEASYNIWDYVLLFSENELAELLRNLDKVNSISVNEAQALQDALISIGQAMIGNFRPEGSGGDMLEQIYGLPVKLTTCGNFSFDDIIKLPKDKLAGYIEEFNKKLANLKAIRRNKASSFNQGDLTYYWIRLYDMPGICE